MSTGLNYVFGSVFPVVFITSLILNPMVFLYNHRRKPSIATTLFMMLSIIDFLTTTYQPILVAIHLLNNKYCRDQPRTASKLEKISTLFVVPVMQTAGMMTTLMSLTRYIQIRWPFYMIKKKCLIFYSVFYISFLVFSYTYVMFTGGDNVIFDPYIQQTWHHVEEGLDWWALGLTFPYTTHVLLAAITSVLTVKTLWGGDRSSSVKLNCNLVRKIKSEKRGSMTILLMNVGNFVMFAFNIVYLFMKVRMTNCFLFNFIKFFTWCFLPLSLSALNPLIIVTRSTGFKNTWYTSDSAFPESHVGAGNVHMQPNVENQGNEESADNVKLPSVLGNGIVGID